MAEDEPLKSAYELAMDRLREKDREEGVDERAPLTDEQKRTIAELRAKAEAKLAEVDIMHRKALESTVDPAEVEKLEEQRNTDRRRVESRLESDVARVRRGEKPETND
jgi:hypothetical protein